MRIMGLDYGEKRIGVAVSDPLGITAQGITVISYTNLDVALREIKALCIEYAVETIVVGNPYNMDGSRGSASEKAEKFAAELREVLSLEVNLIDERLSSISAEKVLLEGDISRKKRRKVKDKLAAVLILEQYLARIKRQEVLDYEQ